MTLRRIAGLHVVVAILLFLCLWPWCGRAPDPASLAPRAESSTPVASGSSSRPERRRATRSDEVAPAEDVHPVAANIPENAERWDVRIFTNVPGASVTITPWFYGGEPDPPPMTKSADASGFAGFTLPPREAKIATCYALARASGYAPRQEPVRDGVARISLGEAAVVHGRVVGPDGLPLPDAVVECVEGEGDDRTDVEGVFDVAGPAPGGATVHVEHPAHLPRDVQVVAPCQDVVIQLERGLEVRGRVAFPDSRPAPGISIVADGTNRATVTRDDGTFVLSGLPAGDVSVTCEAAAASQAVAVGADDVEFTLGNHIVVLRGFDEAGRPFRNASIWLTGSRDGKENSQTAAQLGRDGEFRRVDETGVLLRVSTSAPDHATTVGSFLIDGPPRLHNWDVTLCRGAATGTIHVVVWDEERRPSSKAFVTVEDAAGAPVHGFCEREVELSAAGQADLDGVPLGPAHVIVAGRKHWSLDGFALQFVSDVEVQADGPANVHGALRSGGRVRVTVRDAAGEIVVPGRVDLFTTDGERVLGMFAQRTENGRFSTRLDDPAPALLVDPVAPGDYKVAVQSGERQASVGATVTRGEVTEVELRLPER